MKAIRLYRNARCEKCARLARVHRAFDWLDRLEDTTAIPPTGPLRLGEIAVQELASGQTLKGIECFRLLCRHIPAYRLSLPLLRISPFHRYVERQVSGCSDTCGPASRP